jgi:membrane protease YdiL (CAAX protease family)
MIVLFTGTIPRNLVFAANLRFFAAVPWAVPATAVLLWLFWRYVRGDGPPASSADERRRSFRATPLPARVWTWALLAGGLGLVALVLALRVANRLVDLPLQAVPDLGQVPGSTMVALILMGAVIAGVVEESAFRGYMQRVIEQRHGLVVAILITGTMFAVAHLDFTPILWPYYVAVTAVYGTVTFLTDSILPAVVLHTGGNVYSNLYLWLYGRAEWQTSGRADLVWSTGVDAPFLAILIELLVVTAAMAWAYRRLARVCRVGLPIVPSSSSRAEGAV